MLVTSVVGGATGFATSLRSTPLLLILFDVPSAVVINLTATMISRIAALFGVWRLVAWRRVAVLAGTSAPGAITGALTASVLDTALLKRVTGVAVVLVGIYFLLPHRRTRPPPGGATTATVGFLSGYLSTSISLNGPPVAILLSRAGIKPVRFVADFAGYLMESPRKRLHSGEPTLPWQQRLATPTCRSASPL